MPTAGPDTRVTPQAARLFDCATPVPPEPTRAWAGDGPRVEQARCPDCGSWRLSRGAIWRPCWQCKTTRTPTPWTAPDVPTGQGGDRPAQPAGRQQPVEQYPAKVTPTARGAWPMCHHHPTVPLEYGAHAAPASDACYWQCPTCRAAGQATVQPYELVEDKPAAKHTPNAEQAALDAAHATARPAATSKARARHGLTPAGRRRPEPERSAP